MEFFTTIGMFVFAGGVLFIIVNALNSSENRKKNRKKTEDERIGIIARNHPKIIKLYKEFNAEQGVGKQRSGYDFEFEESLPQAQFEIVTVFGKPVYVYQKNKVAAFKEKVRMSINELESTPRGKEEIDEILQRNEAMQKQRDERDEEESLERRLNYLKYKELVKKIFPNPEIQKEESSVLFEIQSNLEIEKEEAKALLNKLAAPFTGIIFKGPLNKNGDEHLYWFYEEKIKK